MRCKGLEFWALPQNTGRISMKAKTVANSLKNAVSTVFLLAGAFFVCSTFLSMRAVFADPIAPINPSAVGPQAQRAGNNARTSGRASPRNTQATSRKTVARTAITNAARNQATTSRGVATRNTVAQNPRINTVSSRNVNTTSARNVVSRQNTTANRAGATSTRNVRARTATLDANNARVSLQGSAIRGSKTTGTTYSYLSSALYTGNYSNIIDSSTGLISAEAFDNCMNSYYTCMDEICTARNQAQRRCGCAGRVKEFAEAETALEKANEELIKASGELALLIANKGKDVSDAFQLTEAEQVMNCVSWRDANKNGTWTTEEAQNWCHSHGIYNDSTCKMPSYCEENDFGFNIENLNGTASDILANLQSWAKAKESTITILTNDENSLLTSFEEVSGIVSGMAGLNVNSEDTSADTLAQTWGYDLFKHAHNEVCSRVLDSCFNGIYEACGTPPSGGKCANGQSTNCPYNYNSKIDLKNGQINLLERNTKSSTANSCEAYYNTSSDPYMNLRGPVADARRSIMNKYLLDANADCDLYGEQLRATAQNISLQKAAAQQALQQKRMEFAIEERDLVLTSANNAISNFNECISEIYDCYESTTDSEPNWPDARIKTYCAQISNVPHCYEEMICNPSTTQFRAVIDLADNAKCFNSQDYTKNTCRNVVTLNEILKGTGVAQADIAHEATGNSAAMREKCLVDIGVEDIRNWSRDIHTEERCTVQELSKMNAKTGYKNDDECIATSCNNGYLLRDGQCTFAETTDCTAEIPHAEKATRKLEGDTWGKCILESCEEYYDVQGNECVESTIECSEPELETLNAKKGTKTWNGKTYGGCKIDECANNYVHDTDDNICVLHTKDCEIPHAATAYQEYNVQTNTYGDCIVTKCESGFEISEKKCIAKTTD